MRYDLEPIRGASLLLVAASGAAILTLLIVMRLLVGSGPLAGILNVAIGALAIVVPIYLIVALWRRAAVRLAHDLIRDGAGGAFVSGRTPPLVDALRLLRGRDGFGRIPGVFAVAVDRQSLRLVTTQGRERFDILRVDLSSVRAVGAGRISEGNRHTNGLLIDVDHDGTTVTLPLIATGSGPGGVMELSRAETKALSEAMTDLIAGSAT